MWFFIEVGLVVSHTHLGALYKHNSVIKLYQMHTDTLTHNTPHTLSTLGFLYLSDTHINTNLSFSFHTHTHAPLRETLKVFFFFFMKRNRKPCGYSSTLEASVNSLLLLKQHMNSWFQLTLETIFYLIFCAQLPCTCLYQVLINRDR